MCDKHDWLGCLDSLWFMTNLSTTPNLKYIFTEPRVGYRMGKGETPEPEME